MNEEKDKKQVKQMDAEPGVCIKIKVVENGVIVRAYHEDSMNDEVEYVYPSLAKATKELESVVSVAREHSKENPKIKRANDVPEPDMEDYS